MLKIEPASSLAPHRVAEVLILLSRHRILGALPKAEWEPLLRQAQVITAPARTPLFAHGDPGRTVMLVLRGHVKLSSTTLGGREVVLELCGPGNVFGELAVLNEWPRSADAVALDACSILSVHGDSFRRVLLRSPEALLALVGLLSGRLRTVTERMTDGLELPAPARLAKALLHLAALHSHPVPEGLRIDVRLSQGELGAMTGLARESINKHLAAWRDDNWVQITDRYLTVRDATALRDVVAEGVPS